MKVIFLEDIKNIAKVGDIKEVADGYALNFLLPKNLAKAATEATVRESENAKNKRNIETEKDLEMAQKLAQELDGREVIIKAKEKDGKLFGSIGAKEIIKELKKQDLKVSEKSIAVEHIKEIGESDVLIKLDHGIEATIKVIIEAE